MKVGVVIMSWVTSGINGTRVVNYSLTAALVMTRMYIYILLDTVREIFNPRIVPDSLIFMNSSGSEIGYGGPSAPAATGRPTASAIST